MYEKMIEISSSSRDGVEQPLGFVGELPFQSEERATMTIAPSYIPPTERDI